MIVTEYPPLHDTVNFSAEEALEWAWKEFGEKVVMTSSFGAEDMVIIDMISRKKLDIKIATIDTGRLPEETYNLMDTVREKYGFTLISYFPESSEVEAMVAEKGINLFYKSTENRKLCCNIRKVQPLNRILKNKKAWITGLRSDQTEFRKRSKIIELDLPRNVVKINPLLNWSSQDVWKYLKENHVPYNALHERGYPSIGCAPCTRAVEPGENERAGRWWWEKDLKECGLHVSTEKKRVSTELIINSRGGD